MASKQKDEPFEKTNFNPDGGADPVVQDQPDTTFQERTKVTRAWEVGDGDPKDPEADNKRMVGPEARLADGTVDKSVLTPVNKDHEGEYEGAEEVQDKKQDTQVSRDTQALKDEEATKSDSQESKNTEGAESKKNADSQARRKTAK